MLMVCAETGRLAVATAAVRAAAGSLGQGAGLSSFAADLPLFLSRTHRAHHSGHCCCVGTGRWMQSGGRRCRCGSCKQLQMSLSKGI